MAIGVLFFTHSSTICTPQHNSIRHHHQQCCSSIIKCCASGLFTQPQVSSTASAQVCYKYNGIRDTHLSYGLHDLNIRGFFNQADQDGSNEGLPHLHPHDTHTVLYKVQGHNQQLTSHCNKEHHIAKTFEPQ
ncbi:hypothetical protein E2C01_010477 [Portunus trituberculatus]|uniref:Uncharacterized protein n=1 Tax=Portunus trituberculatus TaxID=210409 RepID=A0A5B7D8S5_PORTR|nr:hypothetical protein [Portunus trituberculatus]